MFFPVGMYILKVNNKNHNIPNLVCLLLSLNACNTSSVFTEFEQVTICWLMRDITEPAFTCSKLTIEILEQEVKYVQS